MKKEEGGDYLCVECTIWNKKDNERREHSMENRIDEDTHIEESIKLTRHVQLGISESSCYFSILD